MSDVKAVVFDLGKVLLDFDYHIAATRLAQDSEVTARQILEFVEQSPLLCRYEKGLIGREAFFDEVRGMSRYRGSIETFSALFSDVFTPIDPMIELRDRLAAAGIPTFIFSNTNDLAIDHIRVTYPFYNRFDGHVLSYECGFMKPERPLYEMMEARCGHTASAICYLDDREENVAAGLERGWRARVHTDPDTSIRWVEALCLDHR